MSSPRSTRSAASDATLRRDFIATSQFSWAVTLCVCACVAAVIWSSSVELRFDDFPGGLLLSMVFGPVALVYTYLRFDRYVASICDSLALLGAFTAAAAPFTYIGTFLGADRPLVDEWLLVADHAIGFDWLAMLAWVNARPMIADILDAAYFSLAKQTFVLVALLAVFRQHRRLQIFIIAFQLSLIVTSLVPAVFPAIGIYAFLGITPDIHHPDIMLGTMNKHVAEFLQLRGADPVIAYSRLEGIVVIPSFHMVCAVLFAWAFWGVPVVRWFALALNVAMALSTPLSGGHYLVDLFAGAALAVAAIAFASYLRSAIEARPARSARAIDPGMLPAPAR